MSNISVRQIDLKAYQLLKLRAQKHGVSMEEEVRQIIYKTVSTPENIADIFQQHFGTSNGIDLDLPSRGKPHEPMDFNE